MCRDYIHGCRSTINTSLGEIKPDLLRDRVFSSPVSECLWAKQEAAAVYRTSFDRVSNMMKNDRLVDGRRVKPRYRGGIQPPYQDCIEGAPQRLRGFFLQQKHAKHTGLARSFWGGSIPGPIRTHPIEPFTPTPELVEPRININSQKVGQRRANEICLDESEESPHKQLEGV